MEDSSICGLVGVAGQIGAKEEAAFKRLLELDTTRGPHSTGVLSVDRGGEYIVSKALGTPWDLYQYKHFDEAMRGILTVLMGHNRWATKGKVSQRNAHPFECNHIIGAHNGTLRNQGLLDDSRLFDVDSENIFYHMAKNGVEDTIKKLSGAFTLTWYNTQLETVNFIRNTERPLHVCKSEDGLTVFWASEPWMLTIALSQAGLKPGVIFQPTEGEWFSIPMNVGYGKPREPIAWNVVPLELHKFYGEKTGSTTTGASGSGGKSASNGNNVFEAAKTADKGGKAVGKDGKPKVTPEQMMNAKTIEFSVSCESETKASKQRYLSCLSTDDNCDIEIRVYADGNPALWDQMMSSRNYFEGKVRSYCTQYGDYYVAIDLRSIVEVVPVGADDTEVEDDDIEFAIGYGGELISDVEYGKRVSYGCVNCRTVPEIQESDDIVWFGKSDFICADCKDLPVFAGMISKHKSAV